jgi:hypothetical protein
MFVSLEKKSDKLIQAMMGGQKYPKCNFDIEILLYRINVDENFTFTKKPKPLEGNTYNSQSMRERSKTIMRYKQTGEGLLFNS